MSDAHPSGWIYACRVHEGRAGEGEGAVAYNAAETNERWRLRVVLSVNERN